MNKQVKMIGPYYDIILKQSKTVVTEIDLNKDGSVMRTRRSWFDLDKCIEISKQQGFQLEETND